MPGTPTRFNNLHRAVYRLARNEGSVSTQRATEPGMKPEHEFAPQGGLDGQALWHPEKTDSETPAKTGAEFARKLAWPIATTDALDPLASASSPGQNRERFLRQQTTRVNRPSRTSGVRFVSVNREYRTVSVLDQEFFKEHVVKIQELAEGADPFIKKRLLQLAKRYEQQKTEPSRASLDLRGSQVKMTAER